MTLDLAVARALFRARQIERALHDRGPWTVRIGGLTAPACRIVAPNRIVFLAHFDEHCWIAPPTMAALWCDGEIVGTKEIDPPGDSGFAFEWHLSLEPEPAYA